MANTTGLFECSRKGFAAAKPLSETNRTCSLSRSSESTSWKRTLRMPPESLHGGSQVLGSEVIFPDQFLRRLFANIHAITCLSHGIPPCPYHINILRYWNNVGINYVSYMPICKPRVLRDGNIEEHQFPNQAGCLTHWTISWWFSGCQAECWAELHQQHWILGHELSLPLILEGVPTAKTK